MYNSKISDTLPAGSAVPAQGTGTVSETGKTGSTKVADPAVLPEATELNAFTLLTEKPQLAAPSADTPSDVNTLKNLCYEALMQLLGFEERKTAVKSGMNAVETHRQERQEINDKRIKNLQEQAEKAQKSAKLSGILKVFSIIGQALSAVAAVGSLVAGAVTGNPLLIAGGVILAVTAADGLMSAATDGKACIAAGFEAAAEKLNGSKEAANYVAMGVTFVMGITGAVLSGVGGVQVAKKAAETGMNTTMQVLTKIDTATSIASGVTQTAQGSTSIAKSVYDSQHTKLQAKAKELEAILMRIQAASDLDIQMLKKMLKKSSDIAESVTNIIKDCNKSVGTVLTSAPAMA